MSEAEFQILTPRQFHALLDRMSKRGEREDLRTGIVAAAVANWSMGKDPKRPPVTPWDFVPWIPRPKQKSQTAQEMIAVIKQIHQARAEAAARKAKV